MAAGWAAVIGTALNSMQNSGGQSVTTTPWSSQIPYLESAFRDANKLYSSGQLGQVAPMNQFQNTANNLALGQAGNIAGLSGQGYGGISNLLNMQAPTAGSATYNPSSALNSMLSGNVNFGAYDPIANAITNRMTNAFNQTVVPSIRRNSLAASGLPTSRMGLATGQAGSQFEQNLGDTLGNLYGGAYQDAMNRQAQGVGALQNINALNENARQFGGQNALNAYNAQTGNIGNALQLMPQIASLGLMPSSLYSGIGSQLQSQQQNEMNQAQNALSQFQGLISGNYGGTQTTSGYDPTGMLIGAGLGAYGQHAGWFNPPKTTG